MIKQAYEWDLAGPGWLQSLQDDPEGLKGVIYAEELHWGCAGIALAISASSLCAAGIASSGTGEQIGRWIPECVGSKEQPKIGAYAVTEPQAGSDVKSLRTTAKRDGDDWILNGTKTFISNGGIADVTVVVATVDPELGHRGQASFIVTKDNPGPHARQEGVEARHPRFADRRDRARGLPRSRRPPARRRGEAPEEARARALRPELRLARVRSRRSRSPGRPSAPRRSGSRRPPTSGPSSTSRSAARTACRCSSSSGSSRSWRTWRPRSKRRGCSSGAPPGWGATASR